MIHRNLPKAQPQTPEWARTLQAAIRTPEALLSRLNLPLALLDGARQGHDLFDICVPEPLITRIRPGDINDPILKQILPLSAEQQPAPSFSADPLGETQANPIPGVLHKYQGRILLTLSTHCAINCRYCFRREFAYQDNRIGRAHWPKIFEYIRQHPNLHEVILSGGDPLVLPDDMLAEFVEALSQLPQIKTLRVHTRLPIVIPSRATLTLCKALTQTRLRCVMVVHCNHAQEIDAEVRNALILMHKHNITLFNQSVLLRDINDSATTLANLSHTLFNAHVIPYYCHLLDKVSGTAHFDVPRAHARQLQQTLQAQLPGYLIPKFVFEEAGAEAKTPFI